MSIVSEDGSVISRSKSIIDLKKQEVDNQKRLEILTTYYNRLQAFETQSTNDVTALVKTAEELAKVQPDLEYVQGEKASLLEKTTKDIMNIRFDTMDEESF